MPPPCIILNQRSAFSWRSPIGLVHGVTFQQIVQCAQRNCQTNNIDPNVTVAPHSECQAPCPTVARLARIAACCGLQVRASGASSEKSQNRK